MFSFARRAMLCLAAAAVKAQDELAALGLDGGLASHKSPDIRAKENIRYELTQPQKCLDTDRPSHGRPWHSLSRSGRNVGNTSPSGRVPGERPGKREK